MRKSPTDLTYLIGTTGNVLIWAFDANESGDEPSKYFITLDGVVIPEHDFVNWQDNVDIIVNVDGLDLGSYVVAIVANDTGTDNNQASSTTDAAIVSVVLEIIDTDQPSDTTSDSITSTPSDDSTSSDTTLDTTTSTTGTTNTVDTQSSNSGTSDVNAFPITI
ncbi:hypothetical protein LCGC14_3008700, partial [marine sediment metagenome]